MHAIVDDDEIENTAQRGSFKTCVCMHATYLSVGPRRLLGLLLLAQRLGHLALLLR